MTPVLTAQGVVREWHADGGWGVLDAPETPGGCWAHFSAVRMDGYRELQAGAEVAFDAERVDQDGYAFRATQVRVPGVTPSGPDRAAPPSSAYRSTLTLTFDDADDDQRGRQRES